MEFLRRNNRAILWFSFAISLVLLIADIALNHKNGRFYFYGLTNSIILFRLFGGREIPCVIHTIGLIIVFILLIVFYALNKTVKLYVLLFATIPFALQFLFAIYNLCLNRAKTKTGRAYRVGLHAYLGFMITVIWFWSFVWIADGSDSHTIIGMFYFLIFLFMILTPYFQSDTQAMKIAESAARRQQQRSRSRQGSATRQAAGAHGEPLPTPPPSRRARGSAGQQFNVEVHYPPLPAALPYAV